MSRNYTRGRLIPRIQLSFIFELSKLVNLPDDIEYADLEETNFPITWALTNGSAIAPIPAETKLAMREWVETNGST